MKQYIISLIILLAVVSIATAGVLTTTNAKITKAEDAKLKAHGFDTANCELKLIEGNLYKIRCGGMAGDCELKDGETKDVATQRCLKYYASLQDTPSPPAKDTGTIIVEVEK